MAVDVDALYREWGPMVYRRILRFYGPEEAEEVLHEVFLKVLENLDGFREDASPSTWLYRIATNHCLNRLRNHKRRRELIAEHGEDLYPSAIGSRQESELLLRQLWKQLPDELLQIGVYYFVDGMTHAEIARILDVSRRTVGNRLKELEELARRNTTGGGDD